MCSNDENIQPKFMYCINATIVDETTMTNVVFFNDAITYMLNTSCQDIVTLQGYDDPKKPPPRILSKIGIPMTFNLTVRPDRSIVIDKAIERHDTSTSAGLTPLPTPTEKPSIIPRTPNPKPLSTKRGTNEQPG